MPLLVQIFHIQNFRVLILVEGNILKGYYHIIYMICCYDFIWLSIITVYAFCFVDYSESLQYHWGLYICLWFI